MSSRTTTRATSGLASSSALWMRPRSSSASPAVSISAPLMVTLRWRRRPRFGLFFDPFGLPIAKPPLAKDKRKHDEQDDAHQQQVRNRDQGVSHAPSVSMPVARFLFAGTFLFLLTLFDQPVGLLDHLFLVIKLAR